MRPYGLSMLLTQSKSSRRVYMPTLGFPLRHRRCIHYVWVYSLGGLRVGQSSGGLRHDPYQPCFLGRTCLTAIAKLKNPSAARKSNGVGDGSLTHIPPRNSLRFSLYQVPRYRPLAFPTWSYIQPDRRHEFRN